MKVIVGLLNDEAIVIYKRLPLIPYKQRKYIIDNIKGVNEVVHQETLDCTTVPLPKKDFD